MYYKEWLRVRRGLIIILIGAAALLALHFILLPFMGQPDSGFVVDTHGHSAAHAARAHAPTEELIPLSLFFSIAGIVAAIFAGIWGGSLSDENDGHLALAWTKPVSRTRYALTLMSVDLAFVAFVFVLAVGFVAAMVYQHGELRFLRVDPNAGFNLARFTLLATAWYGLAQGLTASLRQHSGTVRGCGVVVALILLAIANSDLPTAWVATAKLVNYLNPLAYAAYSSNHAQQLSPFASWELNLIGLAAISVLGLTAALWQWRRLEA